jgi:hypothetical protein
LNAAKNGIQQGERLNSERYFDLRFRKYSAKYANPTNITANPATDTGLIRP